MKSIPKHSLDFIDSWLTLRYGWTEMPGFVVAIAKDGKLLFNKAYGYADVEQKQTLTPEHVFRIASHSKTFTATAIMQLQEQGKLRIDDSVTDYLSWLQQHKDKRWQTVTIRQLLSHSAGVIRDGLNSNYWNLTQSFPNTEQLHQALMEADLILEPNTKMKYSNYGYSLLGEVIEKASGQSYSQYVSEHIVKPLRLENTAPEFNRKLQSRLANGYSRMNMKRSRHVLPHSDTRAMAAATGFCSTAADLCRYFSAQIPGTKKLLSDKSKREMQRQQWVISGEEDEHYGLGFEIKQNGRRVLIGHGGGFPGFITQSVFDPADGLVVVVLTNCNGGEALEMARGIVSTLDELGEKTPKKDMTRFEGRFASLWSMSEIVAKEDSLVSIWPNQWQPFKYAEKLEKIDNETLRISQTTGFYSEGEHIDYVFDKDNRIKHIVVAGATMYQSLTGEIPVENES